MEVLHAVTYKITEVALNALVVGSAIVALTALVVGSAIIVWAWIKEELL